MRALILNTKLDNVNAYLTEFVREGFAALLGESDVVLTDASRCIADAQEHRPHLVVCFDGQEANRLVIGKLRQLTTTMALWLTEDPYERTRNAGIVSDFDLVYTNDEGSVGYYAHPRVRYLPLAASPTWHDLPVVRNESDYLYDVFFAGVAWPNRVRFFRELLPRLAHHKLRAILPHNRFLKPAHVGLPAFEVQQRISNKDLIRLQNRSRIVLYLDRDFSGSGDVSRASSPGPRLFETALGGAFQLVADDSPGIREHFALGHELGKFCGVDDCVRRIRHYLGNAAERTRIAQRAQERARREHLYRHRCERILGDVGDIPRRSTPTSVRPQPPTILYVLHNSLERQPFGGTELHVEHTRQSLPRRFRSLAYYPDLEAPGATRMIVARRSEERHVRKILSFGAALDPLAVDDPEREQAFARLIQREGVDVVHFLHLMGHPFSLLEVAKREGARVVVTMPDYYALCPRFTLLDAADRFCWDERPPLHACDIDLERTDRLVFGSQRRRRAAVGYLLEFADAVTCLSNAQARIVAQAFPGLAPRLTVIGWGIDPTRFDKRRQARSLDRPLRVAALGNFCRSKGAETLVYVFNRFRGDRRLRFTVLGRVDPPYDEILRTVNIENVDVVGEYAADDLPEHLKKVDVAVLASIWAETFVLALSEAWAARVVPIVSDIGALGERVIDGHNGLKVVPGSAGHLADAIERLVEDEALLARLRDGVELTSVPTITETTQRYVDLYDELLATGRNPRTTAAYARSYVPPVTARPRLKRHWGWRPDSRPEDNGTSRSIHRLPIAQTEVSAWLGEGVPCEVALDPPALHAGPLTNGAGNVAGDARALALFADGDPLGSWKPENCTAESSAGLHDWLIGRSNDPRIVSPAFDLDWADFSGVLVSLRAIADAATAGAQLFWCGPQNPTFTEDLSLRFVVHCDGLLHHYLIRPAWPDALKRFSAIRRMRLDPVDVPARFHIDCVALLSETAGRSEFRSLARLRTRPEP